MPEKYIKISYKEVEWMLGILGKLWLNSGVRKIMRFLSEKMIP